MRGWALAVALAGCVQVFDLDPPTLDQDTAPQTVTGRFYAKYPHFNTVRQTVIDDFVIPFTQAELRFADGVRMPLSVAADGGVEFQRAGREPYSVRFITSDYPPFEIQHGASHFELVTYRSVRPDAPRASIGTQVMYQILDATAAHTPATFSTGQWMFAQTVGANGSYKVDWASAFASGDAPTLVQASANDRLYLALMTSFGTLGAQILDRYRVDDIEMANGSSLMISGATNPVARNRCLHLDLPMGTELARQNAAGLVETGTIGGWSILSYPTATVPSFSSPIIAYGSTSPPGDTEFEVAHGDPFGGVPVVQMTVYRNRKLTLPGGATVDVAMSTAYLVEAQASCPTPVKVVPDVAIPVMPALDGKLLKLDGMTVTIDRSRPLELTWQRAGNGRSERANVMLERVTSSGLSPVIVFITTAPNVRVDPTLLEANTSYVFEIVEFTGFASADTGIMTFSLPWGAATNYSSTFFVAN
jgi:hypothetical protein